MNLLLSQLLLFQITGVTAKDFIPRGSRFGPLKGKIYRPEEVPKEANKKYFWRVSVYNKNLLTYLQLNHKPIINHYGDKYLRFGPIKTYQPVKHYISMLPDHN